MTTRTRLTRVAATLAAALAAALGTAAAASADGPILVAPGGCALQCIQQALVTVTSTAARVDVRTAVPAKTVVTARRLSSTGGLAGLPDASASQQLLRTERTLFLVGLRPGTTYRIAVSATDAAGHTALREGTFETRPVSTNVEPGGSGGLSSGLGCSAQCIEKAVPVQVGPTAAVFEFGTDTPARMTLVVSRDADGHDVASSSSSPGLTTSWTAGATALDPGVRYHLAIRATDADGRSAERRFTFTTVGRKVRVTLWKIKVLDDGDKGSARGELVFEYYLGGRLVGGESDFHKRSSGDWVTVHASGTTRPGVSAVLDANGRDPSLDLRVFAEECDGPLRMKNCVREATDWVLPSGGGDFGGDDYAVAGGPLPLSGMLTAGAVPPRLGTSLPAGHNGYFAFETTQHHVKFRVYAFVDVFYAW